MTIRLPFMDRIKMLSRDLINGNNLPLNRPRSYEVEILPSPMQRGSQQSPLSSVPAIKPGATVAALLVSGKADRLWLGNQESGRDVEHTRSNLG
jgi:hypothetical protein